MFYVEHVAFFQGIKKVLWYFLDYRNTQGSSIILDEVLCPQNTKTSDQFKHIPAYIQFSYRNPHCRLSNSKKALLVSALYMTGCPTGKLITQHNWKQGPANFSHLQLLVTGEVWLETRSSCQTDVLAEACKTVCCMSSTKMTVEIC